VFKNNLISKGYWQNLSSVCSGNGNDEGTLPREVGAAITLAVIKSEALIPILANGINFKNHKKQSFKNYVREN